MRSLVCVIDNEVRISLEGSHGSVQYTLSKDSHVNRKANDGQYLYRTAGLPMRRVERRGAVPALVLGSVGINFCRGALAGKAFSWARECIERARVRGALGPARGCRRLEGDSSRTRTRSRFRLPSSAQEESSSLSTRPFVGGAMTEILLFEESGSSSADDCSRLVSGCSGACATEGGKAVADSVPSV